MLCPHCNQEHAANIRFCPTTGSPLTWALPTCPACGRELRPGAKFCASCGALAPREIFRPAVIASPSDDRPAPELADNGQVATPEVETPVTPNEPLSVETARSMRRPEANGSATPAWTAVPTSPRAAQEYARQSRQKRTAGYLIAAIVLVGVVAGLVVLWSRFQAAGSAASATATELALVASDQTEAAITAAQTKQAFPTSTQPPASSSPTQPAPTETAAETVAIIAPTATTGPTATPQGYSPYRLAFHSNREEQPGLYLMDPDNPEDWMVAPAPEEYELFAWPTFCGDQLAFEASDRSLNLPPWIYYYDPAGKELAPMSPVAGGPERATQPGCSPDGRYLAVTGFRGGRWMLNVIDRQEGTLLFEQPAGEYTNLGFATFLPAENLYWWMGVRASGYFDVIQTTIPAGRSRTVAQGKYPAIAPDGSRLVYFCGNLLHLCMIERETNKLLFQIPISYFKIINKKTVPATASWSGDGKWVYFSSSILGNWDIYRMHPDGSQVQNLTESWTSDEYMPAAR